ncbi:MAG TPA: ATP-binding protein [Phycisphaerae bacterium]|nr:ATP-binding protein [Phycisphaerae bacterium]HRY71010.1 ATP-binding protein [Phycisphaerae bacterium]HSA29302.1 ATP-binding protein [Phycisphaerae bacterium]
MADLFDHQAGSRTYGLPPTSAEGIPTFSSPFAASSRVLRGVALACGVGVLALGVAVLLGWITGTRFFGQLQTDHVPMAPSTACLLVLLSGALILRHWRPLDVSAHRLGVLATAVGGMTGILVLAFPSLHLGLPAEQWLAPPSTILDHIPIGRMAPLTAYAFLAASLALLFTLRPFAGRWYCQQTAAVLAPTLMLISVVIVLGYATDTPLLYGTRTVPMALSTAVAFGGLGLSLLVAAHGDMLPVMLLGTDLKERLSYRRLIRNPLAVSAGLLLVIAAGGFSYFTHRVETTCQEAALAIFATADLKVRQVLDWRAEHLAHARLARSDPFVCQQADRFLRGTGDEETRLQLVTWLESYRELSGATRVLLVDSQLRVALASPEGPVDRDVISRQEMATALSTGQATMSDLHFGPSGGFRLHLAIPLASRSVSAGLQISPSAPLAGEPIGIVVIEVDPSTSLYPLLRRWPTSSSTAETLLVRREGGEVVYLNEPRHRTGTAIAMRARVDGQTRLPAAMAVQGREGWVEGMDYRGVPVLAALRRVPDTPWHLVVKVDLAESLASVDEQVWTTGVFLFLMTLVAVLSAGLRQRQRDQLWLARQRAIERDSQERHRALFISSQNALMTLVPPEWRFESANPATVKMFEAKDESEFVSNAPWIVSPERQPDGRLSAEKAQDMIQIAMREGSHYFEWTHKRLGGEEFPATVLLTRLELEGRTLLQATVRDITEQKRAEQDLSEKEHFQAVLLENLSAGVMILDARTHLIESVNPAAAALIGISAQEIIGRTCHQFICPREEGACQISDQEEATTSDSTLLRADGIELPILKSVRRITFGGKQKLIEMFIDIGERKQMEQELRNANSYLEDITARAHEMAAKAEAANIAKSEFLANMSHEIRTPMTAILGYTELVSEAVDCCTTCSNHESCEVRAENRQHLATIRRNGEHLLKVINDILDLSRVEAGKMAVEHIACNLRAIIEEVASTMRVRAEAKQLAYNTEYMGAIPETIQSDPGRLRQILINLVANAIKFTEVGGVRVVVRCIADVPKPFIQFDVVDTGIGMTEDQAAQLFQAFVQVDTSMSRRFGGSGLGLAIARNLAKMLGGDVCIVDSQPDLGTRFRMTVATGPLQGVRMIEESISEPAACPREAQAVPEPGGRRALEGKVVLLVEDCPDNQRLISHVLRSAGAKVVTTDNGQMGLTAALNARDSGNPFDVVLMDMQMPILDGYEATRQLRDCGYDGLVIALTAHAMSSDRDKCIAAGCDSYATKPIDRAAMIELISGFLRARLPQHAR